MITEQQSHLPATAPPIPRTAFHDGVFRACVNPGHRSKPTYRSVHAQPAAVRELPGGGLCRPAACGVPHRRDKAIVHARDSETSGRPFFGLVIEHLLVGVPNSCPILRATAVTHGLSWLAVSFAGKETA